MSWRMGDPWADCFRSTPGGRRATLRQITKALEGGARSRQGYAAGESFTCHKPPTEWRGSNLRCAGAIAYQPKARRIEQPAHGMEQPWNTLGAEGEGA